MKRLFHLVLIIALLSVIFASCGPNDGSSAIGEEESSDVKLPRYSEGIVTFFSGDVAVLRGNTWQDVVIGDLITSNESIQSGADSYCELQYGNKALLRIEENTLVKMLDILSEPQKTNVGLELVKGSILNKVNRLTGSETFQVKTDSAVCGVRGTRFLVKSEGQDSTVLAVDEGKVAFIPLGEDLKDLEEALKNSDPELLKILQGLEKDALIVNAGQEVNLNSGKQKEIGDAYKNLEEIVDEISRTKLEDQSKLVTRLENACKKVRDQMVALKALTEPHKEELSKLSEDSLIKLEMNQSGGDKKDDALVKVKIKVDVKETGIFLADEEIGMGDFSGIFPINQNLNFSFRCRGYSDETLDFVTRPGVINSHTVAMTKLEEPVSLEFNVVPEDAEIFINNESMGKGEYKADYYKGETLSLVFKRKEYNQKKMELVVGNNTPPLYKIELIKSIETRYKIANGPLTGNLVNSGDIIVTANSIGVVTAATLKGKKLWSIPTINNPNENSFPVVIRSSICFTGVKEMIITDIKSGSILSQMPLRGPQSHLFGRRTAALGNKILFPYDKGIMIMDPATGEKEKDIPVPDGSQMTPSVYEGKIVIVDQKGALLVINPETGAVETKIQTSAVQPIGVMTMISGNTACFTGKTGKVVKVNLKAKEVVWEKNLSSEQAIAVTYDPEMGDEGVYFFSRGTLYGLNLDTGNSLFKPVKGISSPPLYGDGRIYYGTLDKKFITADALTGSRISELNVNGKISSRPLFVGNQIVAGLDTGEIIVINPE
ncbi:MAG: PQQ-binding-like beta-propeller repeat protein [Spirochaetales bacterium]|nr:PQQ-binding-like beta-propeller repeat protein [Spirochaetales bacterium]